MDRRQNLRPWPKGVSGNPGGRPKNDLAAQIAQGVFECDPAGIGKAMLAGLRKGNPRLFAILADRGYGKLTEHLKIDAEVDQQIVERLQAARKRVAERSAPGSAHVFLGS